ncbi:MAG TPA: hypothetical protein VHJ83_12955 [Micromonosporaceae bacterium]|nr:hypothetical protein [Micromonosporaceae bacterium]
MADFHRQRRRNRHPRSADATSGDRQSTPGGVPSPADVAAKRRPPVADGDDGSTEASTMRVADPEVQVTDVNEDAESQPVDRDTERGLRGLLGSGSSQVSVSAAARARDAARPTEEDVRRAEQDLTIVRRRWVPREPFRPGGPGGRR